MSTPDFDSNDFSKKIKDELQKARSAIIKPNILVAGATGVGKSSLVNLIFGNHVARTGVGAPVTKGIDRYESKHLILWDAEGYESGDVSQQRYRKTLENLLTGQSQKPLPEKIHLVWYCISQANHRVLEIDTQTVNSLATHDVPVAIVLTQADAVSESDSEAIRAVVQQKCVGIPVFETSATDPDLPLDTFHLVQWSLDNLDQGVRTAFIMAARAALPERYKEGQKIIHTGVAKAAALAASPIPGSDAPLLILNQTWMIAQLSSLWDLDALPSLIGGGLSLQLVSQLGRSAAGNLIKLIPGAGTVAGGAINASIASAFTAALGYALNELCMRFTEDAYQGKSNPPSDYFSMDTIQALITGYFTKEQVSA